MGQNWGLFRRILNPNKAFLLFRYQTTVLNLTKIEQNCDRKSADRQTDRQTEGRK